MGLGVLTPMIGYDNHLLTGTPTGDGTDPANAYDWLTADAWTTGAADGYLRAVMAGSTACSYYAVAGHNIFTRGGTCKMQYWTGAAYADIAGTSYTPPNNNAFMIPFPSRSAERFQFVVSGLSAAASIAVVTFGVRLDLEQGVTGGYAPPRFARRDAVYNNTTQGGAFAGRSLISTGVAGTLALAHLDESWVRVYLDDFLIDSRTQGWFLLWSPEHYPTECAYCWTTSTPTPSYEDRGLMSVQIEYEGTTG